MNGNKRHVQALRLFRICRLRVYTLDLGPESFALHGELPNPKLHPRLFKRLPYVPFQEFTYDPRWPCAWELCKVSADMKMNIASAVSTACGVDRKLFFALLTACGTDRKLLVVICKQFKFVCMRC